MTTFYKFAAIAALTFFALTFTGCVTTDEDQQMPWNTPQSWENNPGIPGMQTE